MKMNPDKVKISLLGGTPDWLGDILPDLDEATFPLKDQVQNLGVFLDPALSMVKQISVLDRSAIFQLWQIAQLLSYLDRKSLTTLVLVL